MRKSRFTEAQIIQALRQAEAGTPVAEICRKNEITETSFYRWEKKCFPSAKCGQQVSKKIKDDSATYCGILDFFLH